MKRFNVEVNLNEEGKAILSIEKFNADPILVKRSVIYTGEQNLVKGEYDYTVKREVKDFIKEYATNMKKREMNLIKNVTIYNNQNESVKLYKDSFKKVVDFLRN